ncbi:g7310 [Coccomyxa elongata]
MNSGSVGTTRNRTDLFLRYRNQARGSTRALGPPSEDRGTHRLLEAALASTADEGGSAAELGSAGVASALPPRYVDFKEAIRSEMTSIKQKMGDLRALHGKAALTTFDDTNSHDMDIEVLTQEITRLFRKAEVRLQQFGGGACTSEADEKVKQNVQRTLAIELQKLSVQFRKQQKSYLNKLRKSTASSSSFSLLDEAGTSGRDEDYDPGFSEIQTMRVDTMDLFAQERDREVRNILQSINDLAQIMKDLSVLVIDQGTIVDRIDYNMEQVAVKVDEGVKQLLKAEKSQKQSGMVLCIMFLVCAVIVMLVVYICKIILLR